MQPQNNQPMSKDPFQPNPQAQAAMQQRAQYSPITTNDNQPIMQPEKKHFNWLIIPVSILSVFLIGVSGLSIWLFTQRDLYKNQSDKVVEVAVTKAVDANSIKKDNEFTQKEKEPFKEYSGPAATGTVNFSYPKTWSAQVSEAVAKTSTPLSAYLHPDFVPALDDKTAYALRVEVVESSYAAELRKFDGNIKQGKVKASPYAPEAVANIEGTRLEGEIVPKKQGIMVLLPIRDKTLKIWTEAEPFYSDFDKNVLPTLTFVP